MSWKSIPSVFTALPASCHPTTTGSALNRCVWVYDRPDSISSSVIFINRSKSIVPSVSFLQVSIFASFATAFAKNGTYYTLEGLDALSSQMVFLRKKFTSYGSFAGKSVDNIFEKESLENAAILEVNTLASGYLKNTNGGFEFVPFPKTLQVSPIMDFVSYDFDNDGAMEVLAGGNYFGVKPYHGRFDSFPGAIIASENDMVLGNELGLDLNQKSVRHLDIISIQEQAYLLVIYNNREVEVYNINTK